VLKAARAVSTGKVIAVVQPHRFTRLRDLMTEFSSCFNDADTVIVADVYTAGEQPIEGVDKDHLVEGLKKFGHRRALPLESPAALPALIAAEAQAATWWCCWERGTSRVGPTPCRGNWKRWRSDQARLVRRQGGHHRPGPDGRRRQPLASSGPGASPT
jgi:hypothetical protein